MTISQHAGDVQFQTDLSYSSHHKMQLSLTRGGGRAFIATANLTGFTGSRINVGWADGRSSKMKTSDDECLTFDIYGDAF